MRHKLSTLLSKGFTIEDINGFVSAGLFIKTDSVYVGGSIGNEQYYRARFAPSTWPEPYRTTWNTHKTY